MLFLEVCISRRFSDGILEEKRYYSISLLQFFSEKKTKFFHATYVSTFILHNAQDKPQKHRKGFPVRGVPFCVFCLCRVLNPDDPHMINQGQTFRAHFNRISGRMRRCRRIRRRFFAGEKKNAVLGRK